MDAPFYLMTSQSVYAKIVAYNLIGDSITSAEGNGGVAFIIVEPDAPVNLARNELTTTTSEIGLTWEEGDYNGGSTVIDYRITYD